MYSDAGACAVPRGHVQILWSRVQHCGNVFNVVGPCAVIWDMHSTIGACVTVRVVCSTEGFVQ